MYCEKCGSELKDQICPICSEKNELETNISEPATYSDDVSDVSKAPIVSIVGPKDVIAEVVEGEAQIVVTEKPKKKKTTLILIILFILVLVGWILIIVIGNANNKDNLEVSDNNSTEKYLL